MFSASLNKNVLPSKQSLWCEREREMFYLTTHSTHFIYGYMASDIWLRTILIVKEETRCRHIGYSFQLAARVLLYAPSHRQDSTYYGLCYTSRGALAGTRNSSMGPPHEGSIRRPIAPWANALPLSYVPLPSLWCRDANAVPSVSGSPVWDGRDVYVWTRRWRRWPDVTTKVSLFYRRSGNTLKCSPVKQTPPGGDSTWQACVRGRVVRGLACLLPDSGLRGGMLDRRSLTVVVSRTHSKRNERAIGSICIERRTQNILKCVECVVKIKHFISFQNILFTVYTA